MIQIKEKVYRSVVSAFITSFILFQIACGLHTAIKQEPRFGWGMFTATFLYRLKIYGYDSMGNEEKIENSKYSVWVRGRNYTHLKQRKHLRAYWSGRYSFNDKLDSFGKQLCERLAVDSYEKIKIYTRFESMNRDKKKSSLKEKEFICSQIN